jgi:hypothetical protein
VAHITNRESHLSQPHWGMNATLQHTLQDTFVHS